jgi:hypothetical protein
MWLCLVSDLACSLWYRMLSPKECDRYSLAIPGGRAIFKFRLDLDKMMKDKARCVSGVLKSKPQCLAGNTTKSMGHASAQLDVQIAL